MKIYLELEHWGQVSVDSFVPYRNIIELELTKNQMKKIYDSSVNLAGINVNQVNPIRASISSEEFLKEIIQMAGDK